MVGVGAPVPTSTNTLKVIVTLAVFVGSCKLVAVTVTLVAAVTGVGAVNEFVEVPLASGPEGGPMVAPAPVCWRIERERGKRQPGRPPQPSHSLGSHPAHRPRTAR